MTTAVFSDKMSEPMSKKHSPFNIEVGKRLKALRRTLEFKTLSAFARNLSVHEDTYRAWEIGDNCVPPEWAIVIANRCDVTTDWLYRGDHGALKHDLALKLIKAAKAG